MRVERMWNRQAAQFILLLVITASIAGPAQGLTYETGPRPQPEGKDRNVPPGQQSGAHPSEVPRQTLALLSATDLLNARRLAIDLAGRYSLTVDSLQSLSTARGALVAFRIPDDRSPRVVAQALAREANVIEADVNTVFETQGDLPVGKQYGLHLMQVDRLHAVLGGRGVLVGVVDTSVDETHENLRGAIDSQLSEIDGETRQGTSWHGTAVAGIIAARRGNGRGISGVAPLARIIAVQACAPSEVGNARCEALRIILGIDQVLRRGARVINLSIAGPRDRMLTAMIFRALHVYGAAVVAAAGNNGPDGPPLYPGALPGVLAVGASDAQDALYRESNTGRHVVLLAPGVEILTTFPGNHYELATGTSFAAAHVSGAMALLTEADPTRPPGLLIQALIDGATSVGGGRSRLNVCGSLAIIGRQDACK